MPIWTLRACDIKSADHWYWRLFDESGALAADHEVRLDRSALGWRGFEDLAKYLRSAPDHTREQERALLEEVGDYLGALVLGPLTAKLAAAAPLVVRLDVDRESAAAEEVQRGIFYRPLEIARVQGKSLVMHGVSLVVGVGEAKPKPRSGRTLRVLAVFSLPQGASALNLRQERYLLRRRLEVFVAQGYAFEFKVLQFGVTRRSMEVILNEEDGWDVVHFSGHGLAAYLALENEDGSVDKVQGTEFAELLKPTRHRLQWLTLATCWSAAATVEETRRWLGLAAADPAWSGEPVDPPAELPVLAHHLAEQLDCAVLAMRFPVDDRFAIDLTEKLYPQVLGQGQTLPRALAFCLKVLLEGQGWERYAVRSPATPALFGSRALDLQLPLEKVAARSKVLEVIGYAILPPPPERLVGRVQELTRASRALAPDNPARGVLFHGMSGAGKSSCARELAWLYRDLGRFTYLVYYQAPQIGNEISRALGDLAFEWERVIPDLPMLHTLVGEKVFDGFLLRLKLFLERHAVLIVLDNLESLLRDPGADGEAEWRDPRWGQFYAALHDHRGISRVVATSRVVPRLVRSRGDQLISVEKIALHALSLAEALLLVRELPNLGRLLKEKALPGATPTGPEQVSKLLEVVQGHPKLLELADRQAADSARFQEMLVAADAAWIEQRYRLKSFFETGESSLGELDFHQEVSQWTGVITRALPKAAELAFQVLCCMEEPDRDLEILVAVWPRICRRLRIQDDSELAMNLDRLAISALVETSWGDKRSLRIHASVAEAGRAQTATEIHKAVDSIMIAYWLATTDRGLDLEEIGQAGGPLVIQGGERASFYLLRREKWEVASRVLEEALQRDRSPGRLALFLPALRLIAKKTAGTEREPIDLGVLATALRGPGELGEAETLLRQAAKEAEKTGDFRVAACAWGDLVNLLRKLGRYVEALAAAESEKIAAKKAGLGPWTLLKGQARRLQVLVGMGRYCEVVDEFELLRPTLSSKTKEGRSITESLLEVGRNAYIGVGNWEKALALNHEILELYTGRGASSFEVACVRFSNYGPLLRLGREEEAEQLLEASRERFEAARDIAGLGNVMSAISDLEFRRGQTVKSIENQWSALRLKYLMGDPESCAVSHFNLAVSLSANQSSLTEVAHRLAATLIRARTNSGFFNEGLAGLAEHLETNFTLSLGFDALCQEVEKVPGVRFRELFEQLPKDFAATGDEALAKVLAMVRELQSGSGAGETPALPVKGAGLPLT